MKQNAAIDEWSSRNQVQNALVLLSFRFRYGEKTLIAIRYILAVVLGVFVGGFVNIMLVNLGPSVFPIPEGADITTMEGLKESMGMMKPVNFVFPYLGHALGTLVGAAIAALIAPNYKFGLAMGIGVFFLIGGITAVGMLGGPMWFNALDLITAYIPMGYLGWLVTRAMGTKNAPSQVSKSDDS